VLACAFCCHGDDRVHRVRSAGAAEKFAGGLTDLSGDGIVIDVLEERADQAIPPVPAQHLGERNGADSNRDTQLLRQRELGKDAKPAVERRADRTAVEDDPVGDSDAS
jgi:hypothetical protein